MKNLMMILLLTCACLKGRAQVNFVKNPRLEQYSICPNGLNQINIAKHWSAAKDSVTFLEYLPEYFNSCGNDSLNHSAHVPDNNYFYGNPHSGTGMAGGHFFYDKTFPPPPGIIPFNYRDNLVGRLYKNLSAGQVYCVSFWVNLTESSGVAHNKIGAYLDNGTIHSLPDTPGNEITTVKPQVYTNEVIKDTFNWTKIEGSFMANGTEKYITIGNFFPNDSITTIVTNYWVSGTQYSYYLIDDVSVIPIDLDADAGKNSHAEPGMPVQIGRVGDTTAMGLDCKWYRKGVLIDSGAIISVNGAATVGAVDTYVVVQTICGLVKTDTVTVTTVPVGMKEWNANKSFTVYPNPSNGAFTITYTTVIPATNVTLSLTKGVHATMYDLLGRIVYQQAISFSKNTANLKVDANSGVYILELTDEAGNASRERIIIE
jgi:hypothetical protein